MADPADPMPPLPGPDRSALKPAGAAAERRRRSRLAGGSKAGQADAGDARRPRSRSTARTRTPGGAACGSRRPPVPASVVSDAVRAERPIQPDDPGVLPIVAGRREGPRLDRGRIGRSAVRPPIRAERPERLGGAGRAGLGPAAGRARLGPAPVRAPDAGHPLDRRPAHRERSGRRSRPGSTPSAPCWRPCRPIASSGTPISRGWPRSHWVRQSVASARPGWPAVRTRAEARPHVRRGGFCPTAGPQAAVRSTDAWLSLVRGGWERLGQGGSGVRRL